MTAPGAGTTTVGSGGSGLARWLPIAGWSREYGRSWLLRDGVAGITVWALKHLEAAHAWDMESMCGHPGQSGARTIPTEVPYDTTATVYERNGVKISSFPVLHIQNGAVGYRLDYAGRAVVFSGD